MDRVVLHQGDILALFTVLMCGTISCSASGSAPQAEGRDPWWPCPEAENGWLAPAGLSHNAVMGVSGYVHCNCLKDGKARPPAELTDIVVDEDGCWDVADGDWRRRLWLREWLSRACPHDHMEITTARVANWSLLGRLDTELEELGVRHFPVLMDVLHKVSQAPIPADLAPAGLVELDYFIQRAFVDDDALLCDAGTGEVIWHKTCGGSALHVADLDMGVDRDGFFIRRADGDGDVELFRATRFTHEVIDPGDSATPPSVRFADSVHEVTLPIGPVLYQGIGTDRVYLEARTRPPELPDYRFVVYALRRLFAASVETGNRIDWC